MYNDADFVEIVKRTSKGVSAPVVVRTSLMRGNLQRLSVSMASSVLERIEGQPRFNVAWNAKLGVLRVRGDRHGSHVAHKTPMGNHYLLRIEMPREITFVSGAAEAAEFDVESGTLFVKIPDLYLTKLPQEPEPKPQTPPTAAPPTAAPPTSTHHNVKPRTHAEIVAAAKQAVPAPKFGTK